VIPGRTVQKGRRKKEEGKYEGSMELLGKSDPPSARLRRAKHRR
jgi:hypothetical protein